MIVITLWTLVYIMGTKEEEHLLMVMKEVFY